MCATQNPEIPNRNRCVCVFEMNGARIHTTIMEKCTSGATHLLNKLIQITINIVLKSAICMQSNAKSLFVDWERERECEIVWEIEKIRVGDDEWCTKFSPHISNILNEIRIYDPCENFIYASLRLCRNCKHWDWDLSRIWSDGIFDTHNVMRWKCDAIWHYGKIH